MKRDFPCWFIALIIAGIGLSAVPTAANPAMISLCKDGEIKLVRMIDGEGIPQPSDDDCPLKACHVAGDGRKRAGARQL